MPTNIPGLQITLSVGGSTMLLNGTGSALAAKASNIAYGSAIGRGHDECSFDVTEALRSANTAIFRYGSRIEIRIAPGESHAGTVVYTGYMQTPVATYGNIVTTIKGLGYGTLFYDTQDPLLWQTQHIPDWQDTDSQPFGAAFNSASSINLTTGGGSVRWNIAAGQSTSAGDSAGVGFYIDDEIQPTFIKGTLIHKTSGTTNYSLRVNGYTGPSNPNSIRYFNTSADSNLSTKLQSATNSNAFNCGPITNANAASYPVCTIELTRTGTGTGTGTAGFSFHIEDLRLWGNAYQGGRVPGDSYAPENPVKDMAAILGFSTAKVQTTGITNCLPLWHQSGPWADTMDHLSTVCMGLNGWTWGVFDIVGGAPEVRFADWTTSNTTWTTNAYSSAATVEAHLDTIPEDLYGKVTITYRRTHSKRLRRVSKPIATNPFTGLDPWMASRQRAYRYHIDEPQPDNTLATTIATNLALYYATQTYNGTVDAFYLTSAGNDRWAGEARAGDRLTISDFPGGSKTFHISQVQARNDGPVTLSIGDIPGDVKSVIRWYTHHQHRQHGNLSLHH